MRWPRSSSFLSAVFWNGFFMAAALPLSVAVGIAVGRWLGPEGKGEYTLALVVGGLFLTFLSLGVPASISYYLGGRRVPEASLVKTVVVLAAFLGVASILLCLLLDGSGWCARLVGASRLSPVIWVMVASLPFQFAGTFLQFVNLAQGRNVWFAALPAAGQAIATFLVVLFILGRVLSPLTAVLAVVASHVVMASVQLVHQQLLVGWVRAPILGLAAIKDLAGFSIINHAGNLLHFLIQRADVLIITSMLDLRAVGLYSVAYSFAELLLLLPQRLGALYLPRLAAERAPSGKAEEMRISSSLVLLGTLAAALLFAVLGPAAIRIFYGVAFEPAAAPFLLLLPGACALALVSMMGNCLTGMGRVGVNAAINAFALGANLGLNLLLIPRYGIAGAAVASSVAYSAQALAMTAWVARHTGNTFVSMFTSASPRLVVDIIRRLLPAGSGLQGRLRA